VHAPRVVVVGGGVAGVAAARRASEGGADVVLVERSDVLGGKLRTHEVDGLTLDAGAESLLTRRPEALAAVEAARLSDRMVSPSTSGASVWTDALHPLPKEQLLGIPCSGSDPDLPGLLGVDAVRRLAREPRLVDLPADATVGGLVTQQLGREVVDLLVEPLLGGVYAGRADDLSLDAALPGLLDRVRRTGSLMRAAADVRAASTSEGPAFASLVGGLGALPEALLQPTPVEVRRGASVVTLMASGDGWRVTTEDGAVLDADAVILALPGYAVAPLLAGHASDAEGHASGLRYASVALVSTVFDGTAVRGDLPGTGFLVPPVTGRLTKAATFVSRKWQWVRDAAPHREVLRFSVGRAGDERGLELDDDDLVDAVLAEVAPLLALTSPPRAATVTRWDASLPQYRVGHRAAVARARASLPTGLAVCGAAWDGVGIPACIASGWAAADHLLQRPDSRGTMAR
jgi:oxygen-dependent protoporphyrinogen oxidase